MITIPKTDTLQAAEISAVIHQGLTVKTRDGKPARLAIIDEDGNVIESGSAVEREAWNVAIASYMNFQIGQGHLRVRSGPVPGIGEGRTNSNAGG